MNNARISKPIEVNSRVYDFLSFVFPNKRDLFCARAILSNLPLEKGTGQQQALIDGISQENDPLKKDDKFLNTQQHYWRTLKKLKQMNMIMEKSENTLSSPNREIIRYNRDVQGFAKYLNSVILSWLRVCGEE